MIGKAPLLVTASLLSLAIPAQAQDAGAVTPKIVVTGQGQATTAPDMAIISLAVLTQAETARAALSENNQSMTAVLEALRDKGVEARDLQTSGLQINPRFVYPQPGQEEQEQRLVGYDVVNNLTVRVRDVSAVGEILDEAVTLGVNQGGSISFVNEDPDAVLEQARIRAVEDAVARARTLAQAAGVELGRIIEISEQADRPSPVPLGARAMRMDAEVSAVPIETGENAYDVRVNVTFEIGDQ
jgi:uncharacterized protein